MKSKTISIPLLAIILFAIASVSCKKENTAEPQEAKLENTTWLITKEIVFFQNGNLEIFTRNSVWTFSRNHKLKIFNPDSYISKESGEWHRTVDKITFNIDYDLPRSVRNYKIITETDLYMRLEAEGQNIESSDNGKSSRAEYEIVKL